jgi:hypothetical protein
MLFLARSKYKSPVIEKDRPIGLWIGLLSISGFIVLFSNAATSNTSDTPPLDAQLEFAAFTGNVPALTQIWTSHQDSPAQAADAHSHLNSALRAAVSSDNIPAARLLLQWGADPHALSLANKTTFSIALSSGDAALISLLKNAPLHRSR